MRGLIFNSDGVTADREVVTNTVLTEAVSRLGAGVAAGASYAATTWPEVMTIVLPSIQG